VARSLRPRTRRRYEDEQPSRQVLLAGGEGIAALVGDKRAAVTDILRQVIAVED
jgi:hypothetical protein